MQTASFGGFIQMIIEIIIFYYVVKFLMRLFMPYIIKKTSEKITENLQNKFNKTAQNNNVNYNNLNNNTKSKTNTNVGEYIDYEEID